jgi:hypothetical protein
MVTDIEECINTIFPDFKDKLKIHLLKHIPDTFLRYGHLYLYDTELFVKENGTV